MLFFVILREFSFLSDDQTQVSKIKTYIIKVWKLLASAMEKDKQSNLELCCESFGKELIEKG